MKRCSWCGHTIRDGEPVYKDFWSRRCFCSEKCRRRFRKSRKAEKMESFAQPLLLFYSWCISILSILSKKSQTPYSRTTDHPLGIPLAPRGNSTPALQMKEPFEATPAVQFSRELLLHAVARMDNRSRLLQPENMRL